MASRTSEYYKKNPEARRRRLREVGVGGRGVVELRVGGVDVVVDGCVDLRALVQLRHR